MTLLRRIAQIEWLAPLALVAAVALAFANSLHVPLQLDDSATITDNPSTERLWPPWRPLLPPPHVPTAGRPLANLSFALNRAIGGADVRGYHVVNLAIHAGAALVLFGLVRRTLACGVTTDRSPRRATAIAFSAALLWAVHPVTTNAVTYLAQRTESLMALAYLTTLYGLVRSTDSPQPQRWRAVSILACAAGMACKEPMMTAPVLALLFDRIFLAGSFAAIWRERRRYYGGLAATWLLLGWLLTTGLAQRQVGFGLGVSPWRYLLAETEAVATYLRLAAWPWPLVFDYGPGTPTNLAAIAPFAAVVVAALAASAWTLARAPRAGFLLIAFFVVLAPTSSVVPVAMQPIAENRAYLPLAALATLAAHGCFALGAARAVICVGVAAAALLIATHQRNLLFASAETLWRDTIRQRPGNPRAYDNLASALAVDGRLPEAIALFNRALELNPQSANTHAMLAGTWLRLGRPDEGERHFRRSLELNPQLHDTHFSYGTFLYQARRMEEAVTQLEYAVQHGTPTAAMHHYLALAYAQLGRVEGAAQQFRAALQLQPDQPNIHCSLAALLANGGRSADALAHYRAALQLNPRLREAQVGAALAALALRHFADALQHANAAIQLQPSATDAQYCAGVALLGLGRTNDAAAKFEEVLRLDPTHDQARNALGQIRAASGADAPKT